MRVAQLGAVQVPLSITRRPTPEPGPGEILIKVTACGMCYSEVNLLNGEYPFARFPVVPGHEITGVVAALGPGVNWPAAGTPVGAQFLYSSCGHCAYCVRGDEILCPDKKITGVGVDGGYSEYFIGRAGFVTPLPGGLDPVAGAPLMCAGITAFNGLRQAGLRAGARVAVLGAGGVGAMAARFAAAMGARVVILGRSRGGEARAKAIGAERYVATTETDPADALRGWDGGADLIVNAAPSSDAAAAAYGGLAPDGTLLLLGYGPEPLQLATMPMVLGRLHVMANPSGSPHDLRDTLAFAAAHGIVPEVTSVSLDQAPGILASMAGGTAHGRSVIAF